MIVLFLRFGEPAALFSAVAAPFPLLPAVQEGPLCSTASPALVTSCLLYTGHSAGVRRRRVVVLICIPLVIGDAEHLFMHPLAICMSSL